MKALCINTQLPLFEEGRLYTYEQRRSKRRYVYEPLKDFTVNIADKATELSIRTSTKAFDVHTIFPRGYYDFLREQYGDKVFPKMISTFKILRMQYDHEIDQQRIVVRLDEMQFDRFLRRFLQ